MGRDFRPARVYQAATALLNVHNTSPSPRWYDVVGSLPPAQTLVRMQPLPHQRRKIPKGTKKASKLFQPQKITYEEDRLRSEFFKDHPWELARPRMVLENDGRDSYQSDWAEMQQSHRILSGESVVQRQLWLLQNNPSMTRAQAYDQARREFYDLRLQQDVDRRIAKEEALSTGAYFGKSALEIGMELEDKQFDIWREWAAKEAEAQKIRQAGTSATYEDETAGPSQLDDPDTTLGELTEPAPPDN